MPSWLTGTVSELTGNDSVLTGAGVCPPFPDEMIADGASFPTGVTDSVLTATTPPACGPAPPDPEDPDGFLWLNNLANSTGLVVKDGSDRVTNWINQFTGIHAAVDSESQDAHGVPLSPNTLWPVWTPNAQNGLPGMLWTRAAGTNMNGTYPGGTLNKPSADGAPITIFAVVQSFDIQGGAILTLRLNNPDFETMMWLYGPAPGFQQGSSSAQDANGTLFDDGIINYANQTILVDWTYYDAVTPMEIFVNGVQRPLYSTGLQPAYSGVSGYSVGFCNAIFSRNWNGYLYEILGYLGADSARRTETRAYLNDKWSIY